MPNAAKPFLKLEPIATIKSVDEWPDYIVDDSGHLK